MTTTPAAKRRENPLTLVGRALRIGLERIRGANRWRTLGERPTSCNRYGNFICDTHWKQIELSQVGDDPIHSSNVHLATAIWLSLNGFPIEAGPVERACCRMPAKCWDGIIERSRTDYWKNR